MPLGIYRRHLLVYLDIELRLDEQNCFNIGGAFKALRGIFRTKI